jgi:hypothetical protein
MPVETTTEVPETTVSAEAQSYLDQLDADAGYGAVETPPDLPPTESDTVPDETDTELEAAAAPVAPAVEDWRDDEVRAMAASMGLSDERLAKIANRDAFEAAQVLFDEQNIATGRALMQPEQNNGQAQPPVQQPAAHAPVQQQQTPAATAPVELQAVATAINKIKAGDYDDSDVHVALEGLLHKHTVESQRVEQLERYVRSQLEQQVLANQHRESNQFLEALARIDADTFGAEWDKATPAQREAVQKVANEFAALRTFESQRAGYSVPIDHALVTRAYRVAYGDKIAERAVKQQTEKIAAQSRQRLGGATRKHAPNKNMPVAKDLSEDDSLLTEVRELLDRERE